MITGSVPANMGTKFSVISPISVFVDESLDPASVTATTVTLNFNSIYPVPYLPSFDILRNHGPITGGPTPVKGTVSYDAAAKKVSFVPALPLPYGTVFTLSIDVKDKAGLSLKADLNFMTYVNGMTKQFFFTTAGTPSSWLSTPVDMAGRTNNRLQHSSPGADTQWFSPDDPANQRQIFNYAPDGRVTDERQMNAGTDGLYNTPDDTIGYCLTYRYDAMRLVTERTYSTTAGPDAMLCTADDVPQVYSTYAYTGATMTGWVYFTNPGPDAAWRTPDDRCSIYWDYAYDASSRSQRHIMRSCGPDQLPRTADDAMLYNYYWDYTYDAAGNLTKQVWATGAGADGMWFNNDDNFNQYLRMQYDAKGLVTQSIASVGAGPDMMWGTNDDPGNRTDTKYNGQNLQEEVTVYSIGPDNMWNTADDVIGNYTKLAYDANGNKIDQKTYNSGPDAMFKTADDKVTIDSDFDAAR
jgi:hypothetical protein